MGSTFTKHKPVATVTLHSLVWDIANNIDCDSCNTTHLSTMSYCSPCNKCYLTSPYGRKIFNHCYICKKCTMYNHCTICDSCNPYCTNLQNCRAYAIQRWFRTLKGYQSYPDRTWLQIQYTKDG